MKKEDTLKLNNEKVIEIEIERLRSFKNHPYKVVEDDDMHLLKDSIKKYGILNPLVVRPLPDSVYEIISGHRRKYAAEQLGYRKVPVIIRTLNDKDAIFVYCKIELPKVANGNRRMLHLQIGESCKTFARSSQERCSA